MLERLQLIRALRSRESLPFILVSTTEEIELDGGIVARIPETIADAYELMAVLARELQFPEYLGEN